VIGLLMIALGALILVVELARHHRPAEAAVLLGTLAFVALAGRWMGRDLHVHPTGFPAPPLPDPAGRRASMEKGSAGA
jgi:hypothetical protein